MNFRKKREEDAEYHIVKGLCKNCRYFTHKTLQNFGNCSKLGLGNVNVNGTCRKFDFYLERRLK